MVAWQRQEVRFIGIMMLIGRYQKHASVSMLSMYLEDVVLHHKKENNNMTYDFENYNFHDNAIHGVFLPGYERNEESILSFDIDHILEWGECCENKIESFSVSQALLSFHNVTDLNAIISWSDSNFTSSEGGIYIIDIQREIVNTTLRLPQYFKWKIMTNSKNYTFSFGASSMSLKLLGDIHVTDRQHLLSDEREFFSTFNALNKK
ncbi:hypothetical protein [Lelliottia nimipressuralis]|uniref:hypothetical protein n=1 Tax=Lelliottia nimipressuralis TaxID=69220 RepID=UPI001E2CCA3F|nr:hypothetical protein [Lelliottia nimipressuralis]MCD4560015.1 hypothetical protein [Lelliottia nimipressuralis]